MLWLTRAWAGIEPGDVRNVQFGYAPLFDWIVWQGEQRRLLEAARWL